MKYEEEKLRETENRLRNLEIERQQELQRQLLKEQAEQRAKEEELREKEEKIKAAEQERLLREKERLYIRGNLKAEVEGVKEVLE